MKGFLELADDDKLDYCMVILRDATLLFLLISRTIVNVFLLLYMLNVLELLL